VYTFFLSIKENLHHGYNEDDLLTIEDGYYVTPILEKFSLDEIIGKFLFFCLSRKSIAFFF
jgi:hypothetical protein